MTDKQTELLELIKSTYPKAFIAEPKKLRPLAIGVHQELIPFATERGFSKLALRRALGMHTNCTPYLYALAERRGRVSLDGTETEKPTEEHAEHARQKLKARFEARKQRQDKERKRPIPIRNQGVSLMSTDIYRRRSTDEF